MRHWLDRWELTADGQLLERPRSLLMPVLKNGAPAMLKIATDDMGRRAADIMVWYGGIGAARVMAHEDPALLLERATGPGDLAAMASEGRDDEATRILCDVVAQLHGRRDGAPAHVMPLAGWFGPLWQAAEHMEGVFRQAAEAAERLLAASRPPRLLHGDIHHRNVLDAGPRGWLAIDPAGALGDLEFDYANIFFNPDIDDAHDARRRVATARGVFDRRLSIVTATSGHDAQRVATWVLAYAGLKAAWKIESGKTPDVALTVAQIATAALKS